MNKTFHFYELIDESSEVWSIIDTTKFPHLFPQDVENFTEDMADNIREHFYYREIAFSSPTRFLRHFYRLIKERAYVWNKLLATEQALRNDDMLYNYDMQENEVSTHTGTNDTESNGTNNNTRTPDLTNTTRNVTQRTTRQMDTPDGIATDIDNYLSAAEKETNDDTITTTQTGTETNSGGNHATTNNEFSDNASKILTRKGNIGVMTAAQILGGYREAQAWDVYNSLIFPELEPLFLSTIDIEDIDLW